jgi:hypothetical protein
MLVKVKLQSRYPQPGLAVMQAEACLYSGLPSWRQPLGLFLAGNSAGCTKSAAAAAAAAVAQNDHAHHLQQLHWTSTGAGVPLTDPPQQLPHPQAWLAAVRMLRRAAHPMDAWPLLLLPRGHAAAAEAGSWRPLPRARALW